MAISQLNKGGNALNDQLKCYNNPAYRKNSIYPFGTEQTLLYGISLKTLQG